MKFLIIVVGFLVGGSLIAAGVYYYANAVLPFQLMPARVNSTQTWQQYGIGIQFPAGLETKYNEFAKQHPELGMGSVSWHWGIGFSLCVTWYNTTQSYDVDTLQQWDSQDRTLLEEGTITMAGESWEYQTCSYNTGFTWYVTIAYSFYPASDRFYKIEFQGPTSDTLTSLEYYGDAFTG